MKTYLKHICGELLFPEEAIQAMTEAWDQIAAVPEARAIFESWIAAYDKDEHMDYEAAIREADEAGELAHVHRYTAELLLFLCLTKRLRERYEERGIDLQIWHDSCMDLHWKLMECKKVHGIWGSFVAFWFPGFFDLTRFALGRLQFELIPFPKSYEEAGCERPEGMEQAINVHIPSAGKLVREDCLDSYRKAQAFFADAFPGKRTAFTCFSWMLYEPHAAFLKEGSGVVTFMRDYQIYGTSEDNGDLWRIFDRDYDGNPETLPERTSMQRAYKEWLLAGHSAGWGKGIFFMDRTQGAL